MAIKYVVETGWSDDDRYEFDDNGRETALAFAEIAATHRKRDNKDVVIKIIPDETVFELKKIPDETIVADSINED